MRLEELYHQVAQAISLLDFRRIWPGFAPLKFALYDHDTCFFDGQYVTKTDEFCANTSICFQGEQIAIWMVDGAPDVSVLASKLVHEMFHGFQTLQGWSCWPDELAALYRYRYDAENLSLRLRENQLLLELLDRSDDACCRELLRSRKYRMEKFPYEFSYESKVEEIEGTAAYVEWQALQQLDPEKAAAMTERIRRNVTAPEHLFPIRISCYDTGALLIHALVQAGLYAFAPAERPAPLSVLRELDACGGPASGSLTISADVTEALRSYDRKTEEIIQAALARNELVLRGPCELTGLNVYDARCRGGYLTSTYFLTYREDGESRMAEGNFVIRMKDAKTIDTVYRWK